MSAGRPMEVHQQPEQVPVSKRLAFVKNSRESRESREREKESQNVPPLSKEKNPQPSKERPSPRMGPSKEKNGSKPAGSADVSSIMSPFKADSVNKIRKQEMDKRYPKQKMLSMTSSEEVRTVSNMYMRRFTTTSDGNHKRLIQISIDEVGRVVRPIEDEPYYHGFMTRAECAKIVKRQGEFLVRKTDVGGQAHYVLSLFWNEDLHNFIIKRTNRKRLYWVFGYAFKTISDLIEYHHLSRAPVCVEGYIIQKPCLKQDWQLNNEQVQKGVKLGEGAFGEVYKGTLQRSPFHQRLPVAIKTLHSGSLCGDERIKFLKEANLMLDLKHDNVITLYGVCTAKEPIMIVMELAKTSLQSRIQDLVNPPTLVEKLNYVYGAAKGMAYLESRKIIHRDIAARNCLLGFDNQVKISDFGLSLFTTGEEYQERKIKNMPFRWQAPETLKKRRYTSKTDVYSFGVLIWEIYSEGRFPYEEYEDNNKLRKLIIERKVFLEVTGDIQNDLEQLRLRCMAYKDEDRPTFAQVKHEIEQMPDAIVPPPPSAAKRLCGRIMQKFRPID